MRTAPADAWLSASTFEVLEHDALEVRVERADANDAIDAALAMRYRLSTLGGCEVTATDESHLRDDRPSVSVTFAPARTALRALHLGGYVPDGAA